LAALALVFYAAGLLYALVAGAHLTPRKPSADRAPRSYLGMVFHFVSLTEAVVQTGQIATPRAQFESLLAFLIMVGFMIATWYKTTTPAS